MKVLITGGAGYIGSVTAEALRNRGASIVVLDNLLYGHRAAVEEVVTKTMRGKASFTYWAVQR